MKPTGKLSGFLYHYSTFHSLGSNVSKYLSSSLSELDELLSFLSSLFSSERSSGSEFDRDTFFLLRDT